MKLRIFAIAAALLLLTGCSGMASRLDAAEETIETKVDAMEEKVDTAVQSTVSPTIEAARIITENEAQSIALKHAGFTADQVTGLRTVYEIDDRVPEYEVEFWVDRTEYDYTIHAETGEILSYDMDD